MKLTLVLFFILTYAAQAGFVELRVQSDGTQARLRCTDTSAEVVIAAQTKTTLSAECRKVVATPSPSPTPAPSPVASVTPSPVPTAIAPTGDPVRVTQPSYPGARLGDYPDKLSILVKSPRENFNEWNLIKVENRLVIHSAIDNWTIFNAHNRTIAQPGVVLPYVKTAQRYGFEPFLFSEAYTRVEDAQYLAANSTTRDMFFPVWHGVPSSFDAAYLRSLSAYAKTIPHRRPIVYMPDESLCTDDIANCIALIQRVRANFPEAHPLVTSTYRKDLADAGAKIFVAVLNHLGPFSTAGVPMPTADAYKAAGVELWVYISNMSAREFKAYGKHTPDFVLDCDAVCARSFPTVALATAPDLQGLLYYAMMAVPIGDIRDSIYREDGNMDGLMIYNGPRPSLRMWHTDDGLIDASVFKEVLSRPEHRAWMLSELKKIAPDQFSWSKDLSAYARLREAALARLR